MVLPGHHYGQYYWILSENNKVLIIMSKTREELFVNIYVCLKIKQVELESSVQNSIENFVFST